MNVSDYIGYVEAEGAQFAAAAEIGSMDAPIPPCEGWVMRDLVRHLGFIHLWAAENVAHPSEEWADVEDLDDLTEHWPELASSWPTDDDLVAWYRATLANLVQVFTDAPPDVAAFTFLPAPTPLTMWTRRQASEIAIHRFDAQSARGICSEYEPRFAADMLDELMCGFAPRPRPLDVDRPKTIEVHAVDTGDRWLSTLGPEHTDTARCGGPADLALAGTAAQLYLLLWNRTPDSTVTMTGDADLIELWHANFRVRWS